MSRKKPKKAQKKPRQSAQPTPRKSVRQREDPSSSSQEKPVWLFGHFDNESEWGLANITPEIAISVLGKLKSYETMTWAQIEIDKKRNHSVAVGDFCKKARKRLELLNLDDVDELFQFRLDGKARIWGIRDRHQFRVVWWDPDHSVCPSQLKNT